MKVPADCPGEQTKEERKRLKVERQAAASAAAEVPASPSANGHDSVPLSRQDTMSSLSSGYAQSASRSVSNAQRQPTQTDNGVSSPLASSTSVAAAPSTGTRRNRIVAPPPTAYVSAPDEEPASGGQKRGKMIYPYEARDDGELSVEEGKEVTILEPDGKSLQFILRHN